MRRYEFLLPAVTVALLSSGVIAPAQAATTAAATINAVNNALAEPAPVAPVTSSLPQPPVTGLQPIPAVPATTTTTTVTTPAVNGAQTTTQTTATTTAAVPAGTTTGVSVAPAVPLTKEQQNQAAVQAILGDQVKRIAPPVPARAMNANDLLTQGVVVTPQAKEVVIVKKGAAAKTDKAVYAAADRAYVSGEFGAAADMYDRALKKNPSNKTALYGKALSLQKEGRDDEALKIYERLSLLDPTNVNATANYMTLLRKKDPKRALTRLEALQMQYPDRPALQGQIGMVYADMNDTPNAIRAFTQAVAMDPTNPIYPFNLGALYDRLGNDKKAAENYRTALATADQNPNQMNKIASESVRARLRDLDE